MDPSDTATASEPDAGQGIAGRFAGWLTLSNCAAFIIAVGIILRLVIFLAERPPRGDEVMLGLNVLERSFAGLLRPLDDNQGAPLGLLMLMKLSVSLFGWNEYAFRLIPLLAGIGALFLVMPVGRRCMGERASVVALGLLAVCPPAVLFSCDGKQYSSDLLMALVIYYIAFRVDKVDGITPIRAALLGAAGAAVVWFSHPSAFVLGGVGVTLLISSARARSWRTFGLTAASALAWLASFGASYFVSLSHLAGSKFLHEYWSGAFAPIPPKTLGELAWYPRTLDGALRDPVGLWPLAAVPAIILGCVAVYGKKRGRLGVLVIPGFLALIASALEMYPFGGRLLFFVVPAALLLAGAGVERLLSGGGRPVRVAAWALLLALVAPPLWGALSQAARPPGRSELRSALAYLAGHREDGDTVLLYHGAHHAWRFYAPGYGIDGMDVIVAHGPRGRDGADRDGSALLEGMRRVWVLLWNARGPDGGGLFPSHIDAMGRRVDAFEADGAAVFLYDFGG